MEQGKDFFKDESGASSVEYGLLVTFIALVIISAVGLVGTSLTGVFNTAAGIGS